MRNLTNILLFSILAFILVSCAAINLTAPEFKECTQYDEDSKMDIGLGLTCQEKENCGLGKGIGPGSSELDKKYPITCNNTKLVQFNNPKTNAPVACQEDKDCSNIIMGTGDIPVENEEIKKKLFSIMRKMELTQKCKEGYCHITRAFSNKLAADPGKVGNYRPER